MVMGLGGFFKSSKERERERAKLRRRAFREAENALDAVKDRIRKLKRERDGAWSEARKYLKDGQKPAATRCLQTARAAEVTSAKLEMKRWVCEQFLTKLEVAKTDEEFSRAIQAVNAVVKIDPESVDDILGEVEDKLGEQVASDKIWERLYGKEMEGMETKMTDMVPSIDDMRKQLEEEVAADIGEDKPVKSRARVKASAEKAETAGSETDALDQRIADARRRIREGLEGDK
jgi:hypothetical protein